MIVNPFLKRVPLLDNIDRSLRLGLTVGVLGPKGVGKTSLIKCWLIEREVKSARFRWISITSMISLSELLTDDDSLSLEKALENFSQTWTQFEFIIWDDIHRLPLKQLNILLSFLKNSLFGPKHFVISDENFQSHHSDIPIVYCVGFSDAEIELYLNEVLKTPVINHNDIAAIKKQTGGLPLLINWGCSSDAFSPENKNLKNQNLLPQNFWESLISSVEMEQLLLVYFLSQVPVIENPELEPLFRKFFLIKENNNYLLHSYMEDLVGSNASTDLKLKVGEQALQCFENQGRTDFFIAWRTAVRIEQRTRAQQFAKLFSLEKLDSVDKGELREYFKVIKTWILEPSEVNDGSYFRIARMFLHIGVLLGERKTALEICALKIDDLLKSSSELTDEKSRYLYELLYWFHRAGNDQQAKKIFEFLHNRVTGILKYLLQLELAFPYIAKEPRRALDVLLRTKDAIAKDQRIGEMPPTEIQKLLAQLYFEMAKCKGHLQKSLEAIADYERAEVIYGTLGLVYHQLLCKTNCVFEFLNDREIEKAQSTCQLIWPQLKKFDYQYLQCLNLLAQSVVAFESMHFDESIRLLEQAQKCLPEGAPPKVIEDISKRKMISLIGLGRYSEAQRLLLGIEDDPNIFDWRRFLEDVYLDELSLDLNSDELKFLVLYGAGLPLEAETKWQKTPLGAWIILENTLKFARENKSDLSIVNTLIGRMEQFLGSRQEFLKEKLALSLLKFQLVKIEGRDAALSAEQIKMDLNKLEALHCDTLVKAPLFAMAKALLDGADLENIDGWSKSRQLDRWRWSFWSWPRENQNDEHHFILKTPKGETQLSEKGNIDHTNFDLVLDDELARVFFRSNEIAEFHRKSILRQILRSLIESYPNGLTKSQLASLIWGERYSSSQHDPRIYTSVQRLRQLLAVDCIESWENGYRWSSRFTFALFKSPQPIDVTGSKLQNLILQTLQNFRKSGIVWASRSDLVQATQSSDSSVKRELNKLFLDHKIIKKGAGPKVVYSIK